MSEQEAFSDEEWLEGRPLTVMAGHPFSKLAEPAVWMASDGRWVVKWRDFLTVKQDAEFATEWQARQFARKVNCPPITVWGEPETLAFADAFWRQM